jgi:hypothetical protein
VAASGLLADREADLAALDLCIDDIVVESLRRAGLEEDPRAALLDDLVILRRDRGEGTSSAPSGNAQAVTTEQQIIVAAEIAPQGLDFEQLEPMVGAAGAELEGTGVAGRPGVVLADAAPGVIPTSTPSASRA